MPGNSCGPGRAGGRSGTTAGTAPRPEGCSRARRRRTGAGRTGSGGRGICASQRRAAPTRATLLPPLGMSLSVVSGVSVACPVVADSGCPLWPPMPTADSSGTGFLRKRERARPWPGSASRGFAARARHAVSRGLRVRRVRGVTRVRRARASTSSAEPAADRALADGHVLACHAVRDHAHGHPALVGGLVPPVEAGHLRISRLSGLTSSTSPSSRPRPAARPRTDYLYLCGQSPPAPNH